MTTTFWLIAAVLIALALAFVVYPILFSKPGRQKATDLRNQNLLAYRSRMQELESERTAGVIDEAAYTQLKDELEGSLLDDVGNSPEPRQNSGSHRRSALFVALTSIVAIPAAAILLYQQWGAMDQLEQYRTMVAMSEDDAGRQAQMTDLTAQLRTRLEASPENPDGWAMLGRSYMRIERYRDAAWAFEQLAGQVPDSMSQAVAWGLAAQASFFDSQGAMDEAVTRAIAKARALNPDEVNALGLLGIHAFSQENYQEAIDHWERIVAVAPDHPQLPSIQEGINQAYQRLGIENPALVASGKGVSVRVELAEGLTDSVSADTALFVFARIPGEGRSIPVAVARMTAGDLPLELRLDDRYTMNPSVKISDTEEVLVTARVSLSGNAIPQPGDLQGAAGAAIPVTADDQPPVTILIDTIVP
ncbi:c-type cytochrome biogenesis protein CcmI [Marinobacter zhejiangensis]|uniref:Cytochrome c-type biogenesis protein CcmH n=1 Tax=Marinobacter zhejiangensis TaxID=488535 RepID=A0A1I4NQZ1_9GAMM|nr:c-type cytochrome biogenesis protein CcmI [Marinobacter zhejiangensis]SFM17934.1 cytochrome c-type biogenesis protein CcmH [Marinobacter zhejiangensis]